MLLRIDRPFASCPLNAGVTKASRGLDWREDRQKEKRLGGRFRVACPVKQGSFEGRCDLAVTPAASRRFLLEILDGLEHVFDVTCDLDAAPLFAQHAIGADQEG